MHHKVRLYGSQLQMHLCGQVGDIKEFNTLQGVKTSRACEVFQTLFIPSEYKRRKSGLAMRDYGMDTWFPEIVFKIGVPAGMPGFLIWLLFV